MAQIIRLVCYSPMRGFDLPREVLTQFRQDLIAAYLKAGLLESEEADRSWLIVEPPDFRALMEQTLGTDAAADDDEGNCYLVTLPENAADFFPEGMIALGPNGEYIDTRNRPVDGAEGMLPEEEKLPQSPDREKPPLKIKPGASTLRPFGVLYLEGSWSAEDFDDRVRLLVEFLARHGFISYDDLTHFWSAMFPIGPRNTVLHFYITADPDKPLTPERKPPQPKGPKTDSPTEFDPDAVENILSKE